MGTLHPAVASGAGAAELAMGLFFARYQYGSPPAGASGFVSKPHQIEKPLIFLDLMGLFSHFSISFQFHKATTAPHLGRRISEHTTNWEANLRCRKAR